MVAGRIRHDWAQTAEVLAMLVNTSAMRGPDTPWISGADFLDPDVEPESTQRKVPMMQAIQMFAKD